MQIFTLNIHLYILSILKSFYFIFCYDSLSCLEKSNGKLKGLVKKDINKLITFRKWIYAQNAFGSKIIWHAVFEINSTYIL